MSTAPPFGSQWEDFVGLDEDETRRAMRMNDTTVHGLKVGTPIDVEKLPPGAERGRFKYLEIYAQVMKLPANKLLPVTCPNIEAAQKFALTVQHSAFAPFKTFTRGMVVYIRLRSEADEKEAKRIKDLRAKGKENATVVRRSEG